VEQVVDWIEQPTGRIVFLAESAPTLRDLLSLPSELVHSEVVRSGLTAVMDQ
jgi:hypothetical protein